MSVVSIIGCGFVADLYMRSLESFPHIKVAGVHDRDAARLRVFCDHYKVKPVASLQELLDAHPRDGLILNLTNPSAHYEINKACLDAGHHTYSEKPLALDTGQAKELHALALDKGLMLGSAPCSMLGEAAQTLGRALREGLAGTPRLIYADGIDLTRTRPVDIGLNCYLCERPDCSARAHAPMNRRLKVNERERSLALFSFEEEDV